MCHTCAFEGTGASENIWARIINDPMVALATPLVDGSFSSVIAIMSNRARASAILKENTKPQTKYNA